MNKKQTFLIFLGLISIVLIVFFTPRYKVTWIDSKNFITTEQTSSLYKRSKGTVKLHTEKILAYAGIAICACGILIFLSRDKNGKNNL